VRLRLALTGLVVLIPVGCSDSVDGLVGQAIGRWRCDPHSDSGQWTPFEIEVDRDEVTWFDRDGEPKMESGWDLDDGRLVLVDTGNNEGEPLQINGLDAGGGPFDVRFDREDTRSYEADVVSSDEVTFREMTPDSIDWTCRKA
jgi:hypothetical protein